MNRKDHTRYVGCALAFAVAAMVGWKTTDRREANPTGVQNAAYPNKQARQISERESRRKRVNSLMKTIRDGGTPEERLRAAVSLAMSLDPSEFAAWAEGDRFDLRAGPELNVFRMVLFERWQAEDPESLIGWSVENNHGQAFRGVKQLLETDPSRVIDYFREHPNDSFEFGKLGIVSEKNPDLVIARLVEMSVRGITEDDARNSRALFDALARKSPGALEAALDAMTPVLREQADFALTGMRLEKSFSDEIRVLWDRPDGYKVFQSLLHRQENLGKSLAEEIGNMPESWRNEIARSSYVVSSSGSAAHWLEADLEGAGFTSKQAEGIRKTAIGRLANEDPASAMQRIDSLGLDAREKAKIFHDAFWKISAAPERAELLIARLASEEDKKAARVQMELVNMERGSKKNPAPSEWLGLLATAGHETDPWFLAQATSQWTDGQVADYQKGFAELGDAEKQRVALLLSGTVDYREKNSSIVGEAIRYRVENPPDDLRRTHGRQNPIFSASEHAVKLASKSLTEVSAWIKTLPAGDAKKWAQRNVAKDLQQYDPAAVRGWLQTLPAAERADVQGYLKE